MKTDAVLKLRTGTQMPSFGLGTWQLDEYTADTIAYALKLGYRLIDTSSDYGTQPDVGKGIEKSIIDRKDLFITTKVEEEDDAYQRTKSNLEELRMSYIDLELIHRPPMVGAGEELWEGLIMAQEDGLVRDIGVSNYSIRLIEQLIRTSGVVPAVNQIEWTPFGYKTDIKEYCDEKGIIIQAYSPLTRAKRLDNYRLDKIGDKYGKSAAQILIRWNIQMGTVPVTKANQPRHLAEDIDVFDFEISPSDMKALNQLNEEYSSLSMLPY